MRQPAPLWDRYFRPLQHLVALGVTGLIVNLIEFGIGREAFVEALDGNRSALYGAIAQISGSLCGFTITALTVMIGFVERAQFVVVRQSKQYWPTMEIFFDATVAQAVLCAASLVALFTDTDLHSKVLVSYALMALGSMAVAATYRCLWALEKIVRAGALPRPQDAG